MKKQIELRKLSKVFYKDYPSSRYSEIERKGERPYVVLILLICNNKFALPLRSNIRHWYCYKFKNTSRKTESITCVDFSKALWFYVKTILVKKQQLIFLSILN